MKHFIYGIKYLSKYWLLGKADPLILGLTLNTGCNLKCRHCAVIKRPKWSLSFNEAVTIIDNFYSKGGRSLILTGGEPFLWKDNSYTVEDIVNYAMDKGFYTVIIYTNGTISLESGANTIFVSIDGTREVHDSLRGESFERIINNIRISHHPSIYINYTINSVSKPVVEEFLQYVDKIPQIKGTFFYVHTPYYGYDELFIDKSAGKDVLLELLELKKRYKVLNSVPGLKSAIRNDWKKNIESCVIYDEGKYYNCCTDNNNGKTCTDCGYLSYTEIDQTLKLKPGAIVNALKYF